MSFTDFDAASEYNSRRPSSALLSQIMKAAERARIRSGFESPQGERHKSLDSAFARGFKEGYAHPDNQRTIPLELLHEAFQLESGNLVFI